MPNPRHSDRAGPTTAPDFAPWAGSWKAILALILGLTALRVIYVVWLCPYPLVEDEAHYWEWSRRLGWSYYSKGPGIAWAVGAATRVFGDTEWAIRLVPILSAALTTLGVSGLAAEVFRDKRAGFFAGACLNLTAILQSTSLIATIDAPYMACWALAAWAGWRAVAVGVRHVGAWPLVGLLVGVAFLFKYTALLLIPGIAAFALMAPARGWAEPARPGAALRVALACILFGLALIPVAMWNSQHDWPTVRHLLGHLRVEGGDVPAQQGVDGWSYNPMWTLGYLGTQLAIGGPMLFLSAAGFVAARRARTEEPGIYGGAVYLLMCAAPVLVFYLVVSFVTKPQGNWAAGAFTTLASLAGGGVVHGMTEFGAKVAAWRADPLRPRRGLIMGRPGTGAQIAWHLTLILGVLLGLAMPLAERASKIPRIGARVPIHRLLGAREQAAHVQRLLEGLRSTTGKEPFVVSQHYGAAGQLAFYLPGRPTVYCSSSRIGGRKNQYDYWADTDLDDPALIGRPAFMIGSHLKAWEAVFDSVEVIGKLEGDRRPQGNDRTAFLGTGFRGFGPREER